MTPPVYGFQSPDDFNRVVSAALQGNRKELEAILASYPSGVREAKVYVTATGATEANDRRLVRPGLFWVRNLSNGNVGPFNQDWYGIGTGQYLPQKGNECVLITPNGEALKKHTRYEGRVLGVAPADDPDHGDSRTKDMSWVLVDLSDANDIVRVASADADVDLGLYDAYIQEPSAEGSATLADGERVWVQNYGSATTTTGKYLAGFITRNTTAVITSKRRAVYGIAHNGPATTCKSKLPRRADQCVQFTLKNAVGLCAGVSLSDTWDGKGWWKAAESGWVMKGTVTTTLGEGVMVLYQTEGQYRLRIEYGSTTVYGTEVGCDPADADAVLFEFGDELICPGDPEAVCDLNRFQISVKCLACPDTSCWTMVLPEEMCITPDAAKTWPGAGWCSYWYGATFDPATVVFGAAFPDLPAYITAGTGWEASGHYRSWIGTGKWRGPSIRGEEELDYGVEVWIPDNLGDEEDCICYIRFWFPQRTDAAGFGGLSDQQPTTGTWQMLAATHSEYLAGDYVVGVPGDMPPAVALPKVMSGAFGFFESGGCLQTGPTDACPSAGDFTGYPSMDPGDPPNLWCDPETQRFFVDATLSDGACEEAMMAPRPLSRLRAAVRRVTTTPARSTLAETQSAGIVIGTYRWGPELVALHAALLKKTAPGVPVLVSADPPDDDPTYAVRMKMACWMAGFDLEIGPRLGHSAGDMAAFTRGLRWAAAKGLKYLAKLSYRFMPLQPGWLAEGVSALAESGLALAGRKSEGRQVYPLRTEAAILDVAAWLHRKSVLEGMEGYTFTGTNRPVEHFILDMLKKVEFGDGMYLPWTFLTTDRVAPCPRYLWHWGNTNQDYRSLARRHGITLPTDFSEDGWGWELAKGLHKHG